MKTSRILTVVLVLFLTFSLGVGRSTAQESGPGATRQAVLGTGFTYQGQLKTSGGSSITATCDFQFTLWDTLSGPTQVGAASTVTGVSVVNGVFTAQVNTGSEFGATAFSGAERWLEIGVKCGSEAAYTTLNPRQPLTPAPYALALPGLYTQQNATSPNVIGGYSGNIVTSGKYGATIGGGGASGFLNSVMDNYGTVSGGRSNTASGSAATVGGGRSNAASGSASSVGGGEFNTASQSSSTVGGGQTNTASGVDSSIGGGGGNTADNGGATVGGGQSNNANGPGSTVGGGSHNTASGSYSIVGGGATNFASGNNSTVPGGSNNVASGDYSFAAGRRAKANAQGTFVWADSTDADFTAAVANSFIVRASGGIYFGSGTSSTPSTKFIDTWTGAYLSDSGVWHDLSDRNAKANFAAVNGSDVLARLMAMPVSIWNYKVDDASIRHIGPTAQDFYTTFGVGNDDTHLAALDTNGVALAAIQGLYGIVQEKSARITTLETSLSTFEQKNADLEARVQALEQGAGNAAPSPLSTP